MKKFLSLSLSALMLASALVSCAPAEDRLDSAITLASSDAQTYADWLQTRLNGEFPTDVVIGMGSNAEYGVDMASFENDGYVLRTVGDETVIFGKSADGLDRAVRAYAKAAEVDQAEALDEVYHEGYRVKSLTVAGRDISEYTIYYPEDANENMKFAVSELKRLITKACGAVLKDVQGAPAGNAIEFRFSDDASLRNDGYKYTVTDSGIVFEGAVKRGCMNAVWRFLENECGWINLMYGDSYLTPAEHLDVKAGTEATETPAFDYFNPYGIFYESYKTDRAVPTTAQNSYGVMTCAMHGMQSNKFDGTGDCARSQICYTDDYVYDDVYNNVLAYIKNRIASGQVIGREFLDVDIAQGDNSHYCQCKECLKVYKEEGGTNAGAVVLFANRLSEELSEVDGGIYDGLMYKIFAYDESNRPPKTAPNKYVHVTFCFDRVCVNHRLDGADCPKDESAVFKGRTSYADWLKGWSELTKNIYVWYYGLDVGLQANTYIDHVYDDLRFLSECGITGVFWQSPYYGTNLGRIELLLGAKLLWDMEMSRDEFELLYLDALKNEYGEGWDYIYEYVNLWNKSQDYGGCYHCWAWWVQGADSYDPATCAADFDKAVRLFDQAIPLADTAAQERRLEVLSCHMLYRGCYSSYFTAYDAQDTERIEELKDRYALLVERLSENGFDIASITTVDGGKVGYTADLETEAWTNWLSYREIVAPDKDAWLPAPEKFAAAGS